MIKLETSKVIKVVDDNLPKTQRGANFLHGKSYVDVRISRNKLVATLVVQLAANQGVGEQRGATFAASYTAKGWQPLPSMSALAGKKFYTDAEAAEAVSALFGATP